MIETLPTVAAGRPARRPGPASPAPETVLDLYETMVRIRKTEEAIETAYADQEMKCPVHLAIGQEAVAAGVCRALRKDDEVLSTHRGHAHYLAKGGNLDRMIAELYGKATGCAGGKGGSMHLVDTAVGFRGCSAIVAGTISIAAGLALSARRQGRDSVVVSFFGDGAADEGVLYETLNFSALHALPVLFVCENNRYATCSHQRARQAAEALYERARPFGVPGVRIDGNDAVLVFRTAQQAAARAREGRGPTFIECMTYRWRKHVGPGTDTDLGFRSRTELDAWTARCPIRHLERRLLTAGTALRSHIDLIHTRVDAEIRRAFEFARTSGFPTPADLHAHVDSGGTESDHALRPPAADGNGAGIRHHRDMVPLISRTGF